MVAHCPLIPRQPNQTTVFFLQSQHEHEQEHEREQGQQRDSRMCTRPAHAHTCVAASGAHSLVFPPRAGRSTFLGRGSRHSASAGHPDHTTRGGEGWLHCSGRSRWTLFLGVGLTLFLFLGSCLTLPFALPLFLRALLASLFCCLPSRLVCYKPSMRLRCRPHASSHAHCTAR